MVAPQDDDEVDPPLGEDVARVPVEDLGALALHELELVQQLLRGARVSLAPRSRARRRRRAHPVLVDVPALPLVVPALMTALLLDKVAHVEVLPRCCARLGGLLERFDEEGGVGGLAGAGSAVGRTVGQRRSTKSRESWTDPVMRMLGHSRAVMARSDDDEMRTRTR